MMWVVDWSGYTLTSLSTLMSNTPTLCGMVNVDHLSSLISTLLTSLSSKHLMLEVQLGIVPQNSRSEREIFAI